MARLNALVLAIGLGLGVLADLLFHGSRGAGLNLPLWVAALALAAAYARRTTARADAAVDGLLLLGLGFAACVAWRASPFLQFWNVAALLSAGVAVAVQLRGRLAGAWLGDYLRGALDAALGAGFGVGRAVAGLAWPAPARARYGPRVRASAVGLAFAAPVVFVFGGLLTSADPVLEAFAVRLFDWDLRQLLEHTGIIIVAGWVTAGWLRSTAVPRDDDGGAWGPAPSIRRLGITELAIPLGALTLLLVCFLAVQARYLFGGEAVMRLTGLTYAEFARRGFFELVVLAMLVVPLLLTARWTLDRTRRAAVDSFRALAVVLVALVGLVMLSALARMRLYVAAYGLTEDRLYATAFMTWIGWVLLWFVLTEWRDRAHRFATGAVLAGFAVVAALNVLNPDGFIARTNIVRGTTGARFDAQYLARLSLDAVPAIAAHWPELGVEDRCVLRRGVLAKATRTDDWREWTWSRARAVRAVAALPSDGGCPAS